MAVLKPDYDSSPRGLSDAARHREKIKEAIKKNLPDIISDEAIITRRENQIVKVPIRGIKSYRFIHRQSDGAGGGFGSGETEEGKVIGRRPKPGHDQAGKPGEEPGEDYFETEIDIAELIEMMMADLGLPNLQKKEARETRIQKGWKIDSLEKHGVRPRLDKKRSIKEAIKRTEALVQALSAATGKSEEECRAALEAAGGDPARARAMIEAGPIPGNPGEAAPIILDSSDLRYRTLTEDTEVHSNAVILAMMDVSGSMGTMKKYLARSFYFWMTSFLKTIYQRVEIRFIAHTTEAKLVDEHDFFHKGESGGTSCWSAYELATELIDLEYPTSRWNVYPFHFSDGEDWDVERTVKSLEKMLERGVANFGYGEIQAEYSSSALMEAYKQKIPLQPRTLEGFAFYEGLWGASPVLGVVIKDKPDLYPALRVFLNTGKGRRGPQRLLG